ncbi:Calx-beta domain-containing protein [Moraxella bovis]|uniref:Calx-beta domain-containing protein n=1 Tax=Moraxella bovis TaxID=476 RepID=UPI00222774F4|nr:Calx-beta domain-containing protein [Moraxella bovis]
MVPVTAKNVTIKVHSHVEQIKELTLATHDGQPDVIKADKNVNYEFFDHSIGRAPNHIIAKRKGKDLHVSFEREGQNDDLIIEGFFEDEDKALIGVAEDGHYYYYIPDTGEVADYVTQLQDADVEGQALGGEHHLTPLWLMLPTGTFPWWPLLGLGVIPFLGKDDDDKPAPTPDSVISTTNDSERGDGDNPVRVNVLKNDADNAVPETLRLIDPETGRPTTEKVVVSGQGTWELDPKEPGVVIFTPEKGYNGNPTPINYVVKNKEGKESQPTPVFIIYDASTTPDTKPGTPGQPVTQNVTNNDGDVDPSTVKLVDPNNPNNPPSNEVKVPGQGTWTVGPKPGEVTFTPEDGFTGDPDPIKYVVKDKGGNDLPPTDVDVSYPQLTNPDTKPGTPGQPVTQNVTNNDGDVDPSTVKLVDPNNPNNPPSNEVKVPGQGTWTVGPKPGEVTFTPEDGFTGDPDPIKYVVKDKDGKDLPPTSVDVTYPEPTQPTPTNPDTKPGTPGQPVTQNVTNNDGDVDPSTVKLVDPNNPNNPPSNEVKVPGQGTWTVGPKPGEVTFTPEDGFTGDPDPIKYVVKDKGGNDLPPTDVDVSYPQLTNPDTKPGTPGQPVTQNVTNNDGDVDPSTVKLVDPKTGEPTDKIVVPNEGTWTVGPNPGEVTFTPEDGLTGNPGPVNYYINDKSGNQLQPTPVAVTYPSKPVADVKKGEIGQPVPQKVTDNDENVDPSTVRLVDPVSKEPVPVGTPIKVPGQGTWTQDPNDPSVVIFTPNPGFEQSPTPINYIVKGKSGLDLKPTPVAVTYPTITTPDTKPGTPGQPVTQNVTNNDGDVDPSTVKLVDPNNPNNPPSNEVKVPGQGTWTVGPKPGEVTFTPEDGFTGDPDPIKYVVKDKDGKDLPPTSVDVTYPPGDPANPNPIATTPDSKSGYRGEPVTQNVTGNDNNVKPDTVKLVDPITGHPTDKIVVPNEGTWTVGPNPGEVTFTPVPELGDKDPSPINYIVENDKEPGTFSKPTPVNITYPEIVKPKVSITGLTNVNEAVGEVEYTISLDKPAKENITVTYVTKAGTSTNPAEAADLKDGFVTKTVVIKAGETSATVKVGIVNDNEYEVAEDYNIAITKVEGNASIDAAKDNVTTTIHDDGKGTPDGRDPNNPDNINPNVPSDPAKPPFNPADPDNPDNNPDPRLPPTNPVPDADNDGPAKVSITGLTNVNEAVGEVEYTISLDKPAKENITVTYVTKAGTSTNPAEAADLKDGFVTKTVVIKAGETSATVKVGIVNDNEYEVAEDYNIAITKVEGNASIDAAKDNVTTTIHDDGKGTPDGRDPNNPDNINPNVPSDPAKPPFNPADPDNPDNNPDPRLPPTNPVPDADNDGPAKVSITGLTNVNEAVGEVEYTISLDKPAKENITVTYVTKAGTSTNPAEAADLKDGFVTKTVVIKAGETSATVKVGIVNDNEYEVAEDYNIAITKVEGNASIDAAKDNVTTTIHDDGKGTPDGRDPNNPDNINPNVPSDPAKPPFNPADPDNPDNNPDPRLPPTNPVPDADNDGPAKVSITGLTNVNEAVGEVEYTISLDKPAKENITVTYVTKAGTSTNPAEAADLKDGFVTKTVVIKAGETSATVKVGIVNDNEYEVAEDYNIAITKVEGNASIDAAKDNVTTTIHDDGKGTPDGRDPNNPDNINPNVPSDPAKPPFNPADPDNPDNNPDPRLPPTNPVPDADNDKPTVNLSGVRTVLESAGTAKYTFTLANGKTADKDVVIEYQVTVPANAAGINLAEAADFGNGTFGVTKTAIIKVGTSSVDINVPIINDEVYEGIETFVVNMTRVSDNASKGVDTVTTTINDFNGEVGVNKDKPVIKLDPPAHVSEEGLPGGNKDNDPVGVDKTNATTSDGEIRITSIDTSLSKNVTLALTKPTTIVTSGKQPVTWTTPDEGLTWIGRTPDDKPVLTIKLKEQIVKEGNTIAYKYTTELHAPIDHTEGDNKEDNLEVNFGIVVKDGKTEIARDNKIVTRVEDDSPVSGVSIHNIDVPVDDVRLMDIVTGFSNPDSSNETDKRYFVSTNNDKDVYAETIQWGNPSRNVQPRASYGIAEDVSMINKKLDGFNIPFSLGTFNHDNQGIYVNKGLESVNMHVDFVVSINGEKQTVKTIFDLKHIETPNKDYDNNDLLDNLIYGITPDDFVIFKPQETTLLIGGKRYTLKLNQPEKVSGNGELRDSVDNYDLLVKMEENYNTRGGSDDIRGVNSLYNTGAANLIKTQLDGITREDVVSGKVVIINTKEKANNGFKLSATLIPLDPNPDANNDLEHATNFRTGGDVVSDARLLDPNAQKVIWTLKDITDANKNIVDSDNNPSTFTFKTKYGTFIGNINGSYEFRGADNLAEVVDLGVEDRLVFGYTYQDNDGDSIQDTVVINFNDYAKETTGRTVNGTDDHDYIIGTTAAAADIIYGGKGDDTLIGELGADKLYGGEGNDKIVYDADDLVIDGGAGIDTLLLVSKPYKVGDEVKLDGNIDLTNTIATGFEVLDMNNGTAQNLTITAKDVLSINPEGRSLDVLGDGLDTVTLDGTFTKIDESTSEVKVGFDQYISNNGATLFISEEIKNIIM